MINMQLGDGMHVIGHQMNMLQFHLAFAVDSVRHFHSLNPLPASPVDEAGAAMMSGRAGQQ